jgi:dolichol-phosphate mannosyltransferase
MDADLSHPADRLPALLDGLALADLVIGSRYVPGGRTVNWSRLREAISRVGNCYLQLALRVPINDCTAGYRAYRRQVLTALPVAAVQSTATASRSRWPTAPGRRASGSWRCRSPSPNGPPANPR